jgi:type I restriction enzyme S subunit
MKLTITLPDNWAVGTISDLVGANGVFTDGDWVESKDQDRNGDIRLIQLADIGDGFFANKSNRFLTKQKALELDCTFLQKGDILVARMPDPLGRACIFPGDAKDSVTVVDVCVVRGEEEHFEAHWLMYFINAPQFRDAIASLQSGSTRMRISRANLAKLNLPIPPRNEQTRIVEKIEELFSDLDAGIVELNAGQKKLVQYRHSLLKSAIEGQLTAAWRAENEPQESGEQLLARLLTERRRQWEEKQLAKFGEQGKTPPEDWQVNYPEPVAPDTINLPELPVGWVWASLSQIGWLDRGRSKHRPRNDPYLFGGPFPFIQTGDIRDADTYVNQASSSYSEAGLAQSRLWPKGTLCITIAANIGKTAILGIDACFPDSVVGFLPASELVSVEFIEYFMRTVQQQLEAEAPATAQKNINIEILERVHLPLPPKHEQIQIVSEVMLAFESASRQEKANEICLKQAETQRRNILKSAFWGQLVPQDPNDEPAGVLLERIRTERAESAKKAKPRVKKQVRKEAITPMKKLFDVLAEAADWLPTKDAFRHCGVVDGTQTSRVEEVYAELRAIVKSNLLEVRGVGQFQELKLKVGA